MQATARQQYNYQEIVKLYDLADEVIATIEAEGVLNADEQVTLVQPFLEQVYATAEEIAGIYMEHLERGAPRNQNHARNIEKAMRKVFAEMVTMIEGFEAIARERGLS